MLDLGSPPRPWPCRRDSPLAAACRQILGLLVSSLAQGYIPLRLLFLSLKGWGCFLLWGLTAVSRDHRRSCPHWPGAAQAGAALADSGEARKQLLGIRASQCQERAVRALGELPSGRGRWAREAAEGKRGPCRS